MVRTRKDQSGRHLFSNNSTGYIGVYYERGTRHLKKFRSQIVFLGYRYHLGNFSTAAKAAAAYRSAQRAGKPPYERGGERA